MAKKEKWAYADCYAHIYEDGLEYYFKLRIGRDTLTTNKYKHKAQALAVIKRICAKLGIKYQEANNDNI